MLRPCQHEKLARGAQDNEHAMSQKLSAAIAVIGIDIGKNSFHIKNGSWVTSELSPFIPQQRKSPVAGQRQRHRNLKFNLVVSADC